MTKTDRERTSRRYRTFRDGREKIYAVVVVPFVNVALGR